MPKKLELLAPGGDVDAIKAAIVAGADAVYCGLDMFNARNRATNLSFEQLNGILRLAHEYDGKVFLTLNILLLENEIKSLAKLLNQLVNTTIDGIIVQDLGMFNLVKKYFPTLDIHASTQLTTHNSGQIQFLAKLGASRVNLSRELNLTEIKALTAVAHEENVLIEVFVHGSLCIAFSGQCYSTSATVGNSANRGRCSQACRDEYQPTKVGSKFPLNLKDNSAYFELPELIEAGVDSLKVEGRIKGALYVYTVIENWRKNIDSAVKSGKLHQDNSNLYKVFNRDFTNSFLTGELNREMYIDNPRDNSVDHVVKQAAKQGEASDGVQIHNVKQQLYSEKNEIGAQLEKKIAELTIEKIDVVIKFTAVLHQPLKVTLLLTETTLTNSKEVKTTSIDFYSDSVLSVAQEKAITEEELKKRFKKVISPNHQLKEYDFSELDDGLAVPFNELTTLSDNVTFRLNGRKKRIKHTHVDELEHSPKQESPKQKSIPRLSVLISDVEDLEQWQDTEMDIFYKLPESFKKRDNKHINTLLNHKQLIPWFPAILIGSDYDEAVKLLETVQPTLIVTNNTGIAYKAFEMGIKWIAGPFMNTTNSHALVTLKEEFNCSGAFISNEINRDQIKQIRRPKDFTLHYSIYHPILLMTSRQCFFQQTVGCKKEKIDPKCMQHCEKATTIINMKGTSFSIDKQKGGYPAIYGSEPCLNLDIVRDLSHLFDHFLIDLSEVGMGSKKSVDKIKLIQCFKQVMQSPEAANAELLSLVSHFTNQQYKVGL